MQSTSNNIHKQADCQLTLSDKNGAHFFYSGNIIRLQAVNSYTVVYFEHRRPFIVSKVLKLYEEMLTPYGFVRTHRSHLVNRQFVSCVTSDSVVMLDDSVVGLARGKKVSVIRQLSAVAAH